MSRYMAFFWDRADPSSINSAGRLTERVQVQMPHWRCAFEQPGVRVYCIGDVSGSTKTWPLYEEAGLILGKVFRRVPDDSRMTVCEEALFDTKVCKRIVSSCGRELIEGGYWGNYVAVVHDKDQGASWILRGPASSLPCLRLTYGNVEMCFSSMEDCAPLRLTRFSVDWRYLAVHMLAHVPTERTGLQEVTQVQPGECVEIANGHVSKRVYWDPHAIARTNVIENMHEAEIALRRSVRVCVNTWAARHKSIMHNLSGGLDSSIVLSCLKDVPTRPRISCITEYSEGPDSDEREYARLAVKNAGCCALIERQRNTNVRLEGLFDARRSPTPQASIRRLEVARAEAQLAHECEATAVFSGSYGDQLFFQNSANLIAADFVRRHGLRRRLAGIAFDGAQLEGLSIWRILWRAVRQGLLPSQYDPLAFMRPHRMLVGAMWSDALNAQYAAGAWWRRSTRDAAPGKLWQIHVLANLPIYYDPMGRRGDPEQIPPLFSQPLIETVLRIPTYVLMVDGWDRGLARRAFFDQLPLKIVRRRSKGGIAEHSYNILRANLPFARELLLDGLLVQRGWLDRAKVDEALSDRPSSLLKGMAEIGAHLSTEVWLRQWSEHAQCIAA